jgi:hypothetical protein
MDGWTQRLSNKQILGTSETHKVNFETSQLQSRIRKIMQGQSDVLATTYTNIKHGYGWEMDVHPPPENMV